MAERFFLSIPILDNRGQLTDDQAHHAIHVMRYSVGNSISLFDSNGRVYHATITEIKKKSLAFDVIQVFEPLPPLRPYICVASALPKGDRQRFMVEKLVELGVDRLIPLKTERSVCLALPSVIERLNKGVIEACKQSGRSRIMQITSEQTPSSLASQPSAGVNLHPLPILRLVAHPGSTMSLSHFDLTEFEEILVAIGPEGGFTDTEVNQFQTAGWPTVRLGSHILRTETAALVAATLLCDRRDRNSSFSS